MTINPVTPVIRHRFVGLAILTVVAVGAGLALVAAHGSEPSGAAAAAPPAGADTVSVSGTGTVEGKPNTLVANLRVHVRAGDVQTALDTSSADTARVIGALRHYGLGTNDIKTTDVSLNPSYDDHGVINGYNSGETLNVRIHPLAHVGAILDAATTAAGNAVSLQGVSFDIKDNTTLLAAARAEAFDNAKAAATQYATLGGTSLSHVVRITAAVHNPTPVYRGAKLDALYSGGSAAGRPVPLQPGQKQVSVTVKVIWALG